jgi:diguanylate cyclase (GGDEF)-like protein/PAS domain S-box-containing protein
MNDERIIAAGAPIRIVGVKNPVWVHVGHAVDATTALTRELRPLPSSAPTPSRVEPTPPNALDLDDGFLFRSLMETTRDSVYVKDRRCRLQRVSRSMAASLGFDHPRDLVGKTDVDLFGLEFGQRTFVEEIRIMEADEPMSGLVESRQLEGGGQNWTLTSKLPLHDAAGNVIGLIGITREINELKQAEMSLEFLATHDMLTGLPNRYLMMDRLGQVLARSDRDGTGFAVLFVDIDDFKAINDSGGHPAGDHVLRTLAERLRAGARAGDTVARMGGDEFVIVLENATRTGARVVADKLRTAAAAPMVFQRRRIRATVSVGISLYPDHATDAQGLLTAADFAMYLAKKKGKNAHVVCPPGTRRGTAGRARLRTGPTRRADAVTLLTG